MGSSPEESVPLTFDAQPCQIDQHQASQLVLGHLFDRYCVPYALHLGERDVLEVHILKQRIDARGFLLGIR